MKMCDQPQNTSNKLFTNRELSELHQEKSKKNAVSRGGGGGNMVPNQFLQKKTKSRSL